MAPAFSDDEKPTVKLRRRHWLGGILLAVVVAAAGVYWLAPGTLYQAAIALERWQAGLAVHQIEVGGHRWVYLRGGKGPTLLLLHGFGADKDNWTRIAPSLTDHFDVVAPDLIGFGESALPTDVSYGVDEQARRVLAFADALGIDRLHLGGSSMGGYMAVVMAAAAPDRVQSLLLLAPGGIVSAPPSEMFRLIEQHDRNPLIPRRPEDFQWTLDFVFHQQPFVPRPVVEHLARRQVARVALLEQIFADLRHRSPPLEQYTARVVAPTLVIWGRHDRVLHPAGGAVLDREIDRSTLVVLPDAGHLPMIEDPGQVARLYLDWLRANTTSPRPLKQTAS